jgi:hypothetical protein
MILLDVLIMLSLLQTRVGAMISREIELELVESVSEVSVGSSVGASLCVCLILARKRRADSIP